ncbi:MAG: flagellar hook capping FlgD N-terminal domain-containing protein [Marmoricola sp.]
MSIPATEAVTTGMFSSTGTSPTGTSTSTDKNMFLQLLVAQMRYQDPMNPTDSSQFLSQSAQFTSLEKMETVADQTSALFSASLAFGASGLIGKQVTWNDADGNSKTGTVGSVTFGSTGPILDVGNGQQIAIADVVSVSPATSSTTTTPTSA